MNSDISKKVLLIINIINLYMIFILLIINTVTITCILLCGAHTKKLTGIIF